MTFEGPPFSVARTYREPLIHRSDRARCLRRPQRSRNRGNRRGLPQAWERLSPPARNQPGHRVERDHVRSPHRRSFSFVTEGFRIDTPSERHLWTSRGTSTRCIEREARWSSDQPKCRRSGERERTHESEVQNIANRPKTIHPATRITSTAGQSSGRQQSWLLSPGWTRNR